MAPDRVLPSEAAPMTWTPSRKAVEAALKQLVGFPFSLCSGKEWRQMRRALRAAYQVDHPRQLTHVEDHHLAVVAAHRLATFDPKTALTSQELLDALKRRRSRRTTTHPTPRPTRRRGAR